MERISREVPRLLLHSQYSIAEQAVVEAMKIDGVEGMSDDELVDVAVKAARKR